MLFRPHPPARGFTLVELLISVAIISVLATVGVPTFRRMIQKARKTEAKVALGAVYKIEAAFRAEHNLYGNRLKWMGFEREGTPNSWLFSVGFPPSGACSDGTHITPGYTIELGLLRYSEVGGISYAYPIPVPSPSDEFVSLGGAVTGCAPGNVPFSGATFLATASGYVSPAQGAPVDQWSIDENRSLSNIQDGIK